VTQTLAKQACTPLSFGKARKSCEDLLALLITLAPDQEGNRFISQHAAAATLGMSQMTVSVALNRLAKAGIIEFTKDST
jgi:Mn-dependent DtxR family transcriptional regulator